MHARRKIRKEEAKSSCGISESNNASGNGNGSNPSPAPSSRTLSVPQSTRVPEKSVIELTAAVLKRSYCVTSLYQNKATSVTAAQEYCYLRPLKGVVASAWVKSPLIRGVITSIGFWDVGFPSCFWIAFRAMVKGVLSFASAVSRASSARNSLQCICSPLWPSLTRVCSFIEWFSYWPKASKCMRK
jgi:hypothetical protein